MASLNERLKDNEYKLWIKTGLCLIHTKEGIENFTDDRSKKTHGFVKAAVENHAIVKTPQGTVKAMEKICDNAKPVKRVNIWSLGCCNDCEIYIKEIAKIQRLPFRIGQSNWCNSDVQLWPSEPWEIAKVFMNVGQRPFDVQKNSQETDLSGLLNFIDHCSVPYVDIQNKDNISKVRDARNATMHSASMKMSNTDFLVHTDAMIALLEDPLFMDKIKDAQNAVKEIQKIVQVDFVISSTDEISVLNDKTSSLQEQNDRLQEEVSALKINFTELENSSSLREETTRNLLKMETDQREATMNNLKDDMSEKEKQLKELFTEFILVKKLISQDRELYKKLDFRVRNVEICWDKTASELSEVKESHQVLAEQVKRIQQEMQIGQFSNLNSKNTTHLDGYEVEVKLLNEKLTKTQQELTKTQQELEEFRCKNNELVHRLSISREKHNLVEDKTKFLEADKENKSLVAVNEELTEEVRQMQRELRRTKEPDNGKKCTKTTCKTKIEALECQAEFLISENKSLRSTYDMKKFYSFEERNAFLEAQLAEKEKNDTFIEELKPDFLIQQQDKRREAEGKLQKQIIICNQLEVDLRSKGDECQRLMQENTDLKATEEELSGKIATSQQRVVDLEKSLSTANTSLQNYEQTNEENAKTIDKLQSQLNKFYKSNEELKQQYSEAQEKFTSKNEKSEQKVKELLRILGIADEHLCTESEKSKQTQQALTQLQQEKDELAVKIKQTTEEKAKEIDELKSHLNKINKSNEELKQQFSEAQEKLTSKISSLTDEREQMVSRQHELETTITELQRKLENDDNKSAVAEAAHKTKEEPHKVLEESTTSDDTLMSSADERTTEKPRRCITNLSTEKLETITIKSKGDKEDCHITGMALTNTGTILLADHNNRNIKSVSTDNKVLSVLSLPSEPLAITVLDTTTAVAAAWDKKLYIVNISDNNTLSLRGETKLEYGIFAMVSYNGNIVVICNTGPCTTKLITIKGKVLWSVAVDHSGRKLFTYPEDITITTIKGRAVVVVSDYRKNTLTMLEAETGRYIRTIDTGERKEPEGITVDNDGNVYVCYISEIVVWSNDFKESKILVSEDKLGRNPESIVYSAVDDSLYVSYYVRSRSGNTVDRFRLV